MQVLCYHDLNDRIGPGITRVRPQALADQLTYLSDRGWQYDPLSTWQSPERAGRALAITFDDAYDSQLRHALDVLGTRSIPATAFVVSGYAGKRSLWDYAGRYVHADWGLLAEWLAAGMTVGSHGVSHRDLRTMNSGRLERELVESRNALEDRLAVTVSAVAYPFGRCDYRVIEAARAAGYTLGLGTQPAGGIDPQYHIPRIVVSRTDTVLAVANRLEHSIWGGIERSKQRLVAFWAGGTPLYQRLRGDRS